MRKSVTVDDRNKILETVDILRAIGGNNGFSNLQPKVKKMLLGYANELSDIVKRDITIKNSMQKEDFDGEIVYG